jgi:membrane-associated phospholipid phosphatase
MTSPSVSRRHALILGVTGAVLLALAILLGWWIYSRENEPFTVDAAWNTLLAGVDWTPFTGLSQFMNVAGGVLLSSLIVPVAVVALLLILRRPRSAVFFVMAVALSALAVQVLKNSFGRARPEDILISSDYGSFPSGHAANAATLAAVLVLLLPQLWTVVVGSLWVITMAFSRTYLHAHWLSDTLGGVLVGVGMALVCAAVLAGWLDRERTPGRAVTGRPERLPGG